MTYKTVWEQASPASPEVDRSSSPKICHTSSSKGLNHRAIRCILWFDFGQEAAAILWSFPPRPREAQFTLNGMEIRLLNRTDLATVMAFKDVPAWNCALADWERFLRLNPTGCFAADESGKVIGAVTTLPYKGGTGSIGMLVVDPNYRRRGIGTRLLNCAVDQLEGRGARNVHMVTPQISKSIFERVGFAAESKIVRWVLHRQPGEAPRLARTTLPDFDKILAADRDVFGADRGELLQSLHADAPDFTLASELESEVIGYALGRGGAQADHLGPWIAWDHPTARELLAEFLSRSGRDTVIVDCPKNNDMARELLLSHGFRISRSMTRMRRGLDAPVGQPELLCGILGPEFA